MGRLCRRFRPPSGPVVVRLCQDGWPPRAHEHEANMPHIRWSSPPDVALRMLESICGPCKCHIEAAEKVFDPTFWAG